MKDNNLIKTLLPHLYFIAIPLFIFRNLLGRGYILALDMIFTPDMNFDSLNGYGTYSEIVRDWILHQSAQIIQADIIQKVILILIFYLSGILMYKLLRRLNLSILIAIIGATFYIINPFIYTRLLAGHWAFLLGYALLPYFYNLLNGLFNKSKISKSDFIKPILIWIITSMISVHHYYLFGIVISVYFITLLITKENRKQLAKRFITITIISSVISLFWIPFSLNHVGPILFTSDQLHFFAPTPDSSMGLTYNLIAMYGFWAEKTVGSMPKDKYSLWAPVFFMFISFTSLALLFKASRLFQAKVKIKQFIRQYNKYLALGIIGLIGLLLAHGSFGLMSGLWDVFFNKLPILQPFRDSQKFLSLYIFAFIVVFSKSLSFFTLQFPKTIKFIFLSYIFLFILLYTQNLFTLNKEFTLIDYPNSYYQTEAITSETDKILVLPWEPYSFYGFVGKQIANPAPSFFSADVISNTQLLEFTDLDCHITFTENDGELCLNLNDSADIWSNQLRTFQINYILINKIYDYEIYDAIEDIQGIEVVFEDDFGIVYKL